MVWQYEEGEVRGEAVDDEKVEGGERYHDVRGTIDW